MSELARFYGIVIAIFARGEIGRHNRPHIHARYGEFVASIDLDGDVLSGRLPGTALQLVRRWIRLHRDEIEAAWREVRQGRYPARIPPLR
jgi:hypothetical protein